MAELTASSVTINDLGTSLAGEGTDEVAAIIEKRGGKAISDFSDVGDEEQVDLAVERAYSQLGRLDICGFSSFVATRRAPTCDVRDVLT